MLNPSMIEQLLITVETAESSAAQQALMQLDEIGISFATPDFAKSHDEYLEHLSTRGISDETEEELEEDEGE